MWTGQDKGVERGNDEETEDKCRGNFIKVGVKIMDDGTRRGPHDSKLARSCLILEAGSGLVSAWIVACL